ncbi:hypothetical protein [Mycobacterium angelicum]|uniref:SMP-30/Gluconolactonase/LRE-like region domain-containing protein n=1 Tax=Mycobacterium angelicum TaxID=470074 RepID=A0A1W9ZVE9_MYCAN|nr:hypothetical protein [Mycobacterium angelicum]MCV7200179.1 hypothetical protein [Mycobacterium angelicum]ORA21723.1 hypothetical protein BST12_11745 [Mycobacterium angelicum]
MLAFVGIVIVVAAVLVCEHYPQLLVRHRPVSGTREPNQPWTPTQTVIPFIGLSGPEGVAVDSAGNVYVADSGNSRVVKLAPESGTQQVVGFTGLNRPLGVAVDLANNVYTFDQENRVVELVGGRSAQRVLPFSGSPSGMAVDSGGNLYISQCVDHRVIKLDTRSNAQQVLAFSGLACASCPTPCPRSGKAAGSF